MGTAGNYSGREAPWNLGDAAGRSHYHDLVPAFKKECLGTGDGRKRFPHPEYIKRKEVRHEKTQIHPSFVCFPVHNNCAPAFAEL